MSFGLGSILDVTKAKTPLLAWNMVKRKGWIHWQPTGTALLFLREPVGRVYEERVQFEMTSPVEEEMPEAIHEPQPSSSFSLNNAYDTAESIDGAAAYAASHSRASTPQHMIQSQYPPPPLPAPPVAYEQPQYSPELDSDRASQLSYQQSVLSSRRASRRRSSIQSARGLGQPFMRTQSQVSHASSRSSLYRVPYHLQDQHTPGPYNPAMVPDSYVQYAPSSSSNQLVSPMTPPTPPSQFAAYPSALPMSFYSRDTSDMLYSSNAEPSPVINQVGRPSSMYAPAHQQHPLQRSMTDTDPSLHSSDKAIFRIVEMGFTAQQAKEALKITDMGDGLRVDRAVELLLRRQGCA
jgi:hypothetical protein